MTESATGITAVGIMAVGFAAQLFFSARILVQWILSERARRVLSPAAFWVLSLCGSYLMCLYGWLRHDFAIILGQFISYYIYLWNLHSKGILPRLHVLLRAVLLLTPLAAVAAVLSGGPGEVVGSLFRNRDIPLWLIVFGSAGQVIFTMRFIYQWFYSYRRHESVLPAGFWIISLVGSMTIVSYGIMRSDIVLIVGQSFGLVAYVRNLLIGHRSKSSRSSKSSKP